MAVGRFCCADTKSKARVRRGNDIDERLCGDHMVVVEVGVKPVTLPRGRWTFAKLRA
jgi:hypothetical protein